MPAGLSESQRVYQNSLDCFRVVLQPRRKQCEDFTSDRGDQNLRCCFRGCGGALLLVAYDGFKVIL